MRVLVVNAGSSSLKLAVVAADGAAGESVVAAREIGAPGGRVPDDGALRALGELGALDGDGRAAVDAVGHRIVHGGERFHGPVPVDGAVRAALGDLAALAPLHQRAGLDAMATVDAVLPGVPAVACFDTAFHATLPPAAAVYALPQEWRRRWGRELLGPGRARRVVVCHLGSGASLAAVLDGASVDTTMGFTPLEGLVMATRSGSVDPGLVLWLQTAAGLDAGEVSEGLERRSGLAGLAGTPDMREVVDGDAEGDPDAALALAVYVHRLAAEIAAMAAALGGVDAAVFTGGVGERSPAVRARAAAAVAFLGVAVDPVSNAAAGGDTEADISAAGAPVATWVIPAREELEIARGVRRVLDP